MACTNLSGGTLGQVMASTNLSGEKEQSSRRQGRGEDMVATSRNI